MKHTFFTLVFLSFCFFDIQGGNNRTSLIGEISEMNISPVFFIQNNSELKLQYDNIVKFYQNEDYINALEKAFSLLSLCNKNNDKYWSHKTLFLIADIYDKTNKFNESLEYYKKSLEIIKSNSKFDKNNNKVFSESNYAIIYLKIGSLYQKLNGFKEENKKLHYIDSARYYYEKIQNLTQLNVEIETIRAKAYNNLSGIYRNDSLYDLAKEFAIKAIEIHRQRNNKISEAAAKGNLASIFLDQNNYKEAKKTYKEAVDLIEFEKSDRALRVRESLYYNLAYNLYKLKDYEAYSYQEKSFDLKDTLRNKEIRRIIEEIGFKFNFNREKELLEKEQELKLLEQKDKVNTIVMVSVLILILLLLIITYYIVKQKNLQIQLSKTALIQTQNLDKLKSDSQVRILNATIDGKESERKEIAETLHDSVSALLSSANLHLQASRKQFLGKDPLEIDKAQKIINEASSKIRDLSHSLMSSVLLKFGLNFAIKDIAEKYSNSSLCIDTQIGQLRRYDQNFEIKVHNIIQEFVNNILKHSNAENAFIKLKEEDGSLMLTISDDGIGFDKKKAANKDGLGLNQIDARIKVMKGKFKIITSKDNGTVIKVELPIQERELI